MLTNATVKAARPDARRPYKLGDAGGLYLYVTPNGRKSWRMKCRFDGKEKLLTFGAYPDVGLGDARDRRDDAREQLRRGEDPSGARRRAIVAAAAAEEERAAAATFEDVARRWHAHQVRRWSAVHAGDVLASLERAVFPAIGAMPVAAITVPVVLNALRSVESRRRVETARRLRQRISAVFGFAISEGVATHDPAAIVSRALAPTPAPRRQPALVDLDDARALVAAVQGVAAAPIAKLASQFLALTAVRLGALRGARWSEFEDLDGAAPIWRVPAARMKLKKAKKADVSFDHMVPLSAQAVQVLRAARDIGGEYAFAGCNYAFPGRGGTRPIGEGAIGALYEQAGFAERHVPHGWRATFSTIMNERFPEDRAVIDLALAHAPKDKVEAAYNRAEHLGRRRCLFDRWAALLIP